MVNQQLWFLVVFLCVSDGRVGEEIDRTEAHQEAILLLQVVHVCAM